MSGRLGDWTEGLIGGAEGLGLLEAVSPLTWLRPPEEMERAASTLERLAERTGVPEHAERAEWLRACADLGRGCLRSVEREGLRYDWSRRAIVGPKGGGRGRPRESHVLAVGAAWEQLQVPRNRKYHRDTARAIRDRLAGLLPSEELTDAKIKDRIRQYLRLAAGE